MTTTDDETPSYRDIQVVASRISARHRVSRVDYNRTYIEETIARLTQQVWDKVTEDNAHLGRDPLAEVVIYVEGMAFPFPEDIEDTIENRVTFQGAVERAEEERTNLFVLTTLGYRAVR